MRILIFEPDASGHQMEYIRYLLRAIKRNFAGAQVILLVSAEAAGHPNCRNVVKEFAHIVTLRIAPEVVEGNRFFRMLDPYFERQ